jgi:hypothetical protein
MSSTEVSAASCTGASAEPETLGPQPYLRHRLLARDVDRAMAGPCQEAGGLRQQRRLADAGVAADQQHRAPDKTAAGDAIELGHAGRQAGASWLLPVSVSSANSRPLRLERIETGIEVAPVSSSTSVFHSPQDSHLPCQRLYAAPQFWQTKERLFLAIG